MNEVLELVPAATLAQIALAIVVLYAVYRVGWVARKGPNGERLSSILMPGWQHDKEMEACEKREAATRRFYETQFAEVRRQTDVRVSEVRGYRDEAMASNATLLASLDSATKDLGAVLRLLEELADKEPHVTKRNGDGEPKPMTDAEIAEKLRRQEQEADQARARYSSVHAEVQRVLNHYSRLPQRRKNA